MAATSQYADLLKLFREQQLAKGVAPDQLVIYAQKTANQVKQLADTTVKIQQNNDKANKFSDQVCQEISSYEWGNKTIKARAIDFLYQRDFCTLMWSMKSTRMAYNRDEDGVLTNDKGGVEESVEHVELTFPIVMNIKVLRTAKHCFEEARKANGDDELIRKATVKYLCAMYIEVSNVVNKLMHDGAADSREEEADILEANKSMWPVVTKKQFNWLEFKKNPYIYYMDVYICLGITNQKKVLDMFTGIIDKLIAFRAQKIKIFKNRDRSIKYTKTLAKSMVVLGETIVKNAEQEQLAEGIKHEMGDNYEEFKKYSEGVQLANINKIAPPEIEAVAVDDDDEQRHCDFDALYSEAILTEACGGKVNPYRLIQPHIELAWAPDRTKPFRVSKPSTKKRRAAAPAPAATKRRAVAATPQSSPVVSSEDEDEAEVEEEDDAVEN